MKNTAVKLLSVKNLALCIKMKIDRDGVVVSEGGAVELSNALLIRSCLSG